MSRQRSAHRARPDFGPTPVRRLVVIGVLVAVVASAIGYGISVLASSGSTGSSAGGSTGGGTTSSSRPPGLAIPGCLEPAPATAVSVGPPAGTDVPSYLQARRDLLVRCAEAVPDDEAVAVVSLAGSANPTAAAAFVGRVSVLTAFVRIPGGPPLVLPVADPIGAASPQTPSITTAYATLAAALTARAATRPASAESDRAQAAALGQSCGCLYALTVAAPLRTLAALAANSAIRLVDIAPVGTAASAVRARPILPDEIVALAAVGTPTLFSEAP